MSKDTTGEVLELLDTAVAGMGGQNRPGQHEMARQVTQAIDEGQHLLVQAGTGTGKSLAYLVPLIHHALDSTKPTLVSTATLALQSQIVGRDLPRLLKTLKPKLPRDVDVALLKGRSNYVCLHKTGGGFPRRKIPPPPCSPSARTAPWGIPRRRPPPPWDGKWCGCASGPTRPTPGTATTSFPG